MKKKKYKKTTKAVFVVDRSKEIPQEHRQQIEKSREQCDLIIPKILEILNSHKVTTPAAVNILTRLLFVAINRVSIDSRADAAITVCEAIKTMVHDEILEELSEGKQ